MKTMKNRLLACYLMLAAVFLCGISVQNSNAQGQPVTVTIEPVFSDACGGTFHCCQQITVTVNNFQYTDFTLDLGTNNGTNPSKSCWDWSCAKTSAGVITAAGPPLTIKFTPPIQAVNTFQIIICPSANSDNCAYDWTTFTWTMMDNSGAFPPGPPQGGSLNINPCPNTDPGTACTGCDRLLVNSNNQCYTQFCIKEKYIPSAGEGQSFNVYFLPPLPPLPCQTDCSTENIFGDGNNQLGTPTAVTIQPGNQPATLITVTPNQPLLGCQTTCFSIPKCVPLQMYQVTIVDPNDPSAQWHACSEQTQIIAMKETQPVNSIPGTNNGASESNYPNPLTSALDFRTSIPFMMTNNGGDAKVSVFDESGKIIYTDISTFAGSGRHFFFFTGKDLPAGKYFYSIESPLGVTIVERTLLIVR
jgi:hypothetical protein